MSFLTPKVPEVHAPNPPPPPPERGSDATAALAASQRAAAARRKGSAYTSLTGGTGAGSGYSAVRFLGGAAST